MKLPKTATETYHLLKDVYGNKCLSRARGFEWFNHFQDDREDVEGDTCSSRPYALETHEKIENKSVIWSELTVA